MASAADVSAAFRMRGIVFLLLAGIVMNSAAAMADETYLFVKMECHPDTKSASVHVFAKSNEEGKALWDHPSKDVYPVVDDKVRTCMLDDKRKVHVGPSYTVPIGQVQDIHIGLTPKGEIRGLPVGYMLDYKDFDVSFHVNENGKVSARYCASTDTNFMDKIKEQFASEFKEHKRICETASEAGKIYDVEEGSIGEGK